jgi:RTX calcium-binding nonapeptide repeat (4 copies)
MADYAAQDYTTAVPAITLSPDQLLAWSGASVTFFSSTQISISIRDGQNNGLPGNYDLVLIGSFTTVFGGFVSGGTVTSVSGYLTTGGSRLALLDSISIDIASLIAPGPPIGLLSPSASSVLGGGDTLNGNFGNDVLTGYGGGDLITGGQGDDSLDGK